MPGTPRSILDWKPGFNLEILTPFQRELVTGTGLVTALLEKEFGESIQAVKLRQSTEHPREPDPWLHEVDEVIVREVALQGVTSGINYLYAHVRLAAQRIPESVRRDLANTNEPLGILLTRAGLDLSRELLSAGIEPVGSLRNLFDTSGDEELIWRSYRIRHRATPIAYICEKLPRSPAREADSPEPAGRGVTGRRQSM